jgi:hypothetical protein
MKKSITLLAFFGLILAMPSLAQGFNPNFILDDNEVNDSTSMSLSDIQQFLNDRGGALASYQTKACLVQDVAFGLPCSGPMTSAAEIIYDRARTNGINPKFIIVLLQKEMSLIEVKNPSSRQYDWAVGYGCFDGLACKERYRGFWKQINSATLQFRDYMDSPKSYNYKIGQTYTIYNTDNPPTLVTPMNQATCAFYNYTPHVYWGNYNFYNIWQRYFTRDYPNGTLLQVSGDPTVWIIQNGMKRSFRSRGALTSRYDVRKLITVSKNDLDKYVTGLPINFAQYSIVRTPNGGLFLLVDDTRRGFVSKAAFSRLGFSQEEIVNAKWDELAGYREASPITTTTSYPTGALLQDKKTGGVYWVVNGQKASVPDRVVLKAMFKNRKVFAVNSKELAKYQTIDPVKFPDGELLRTANSSTVYVIADGKKRAINSGIVFESLKYKWQNVIFVPEKILYLYPDGPVLKLKIDSSNIGNAPDPALTVPSAAVSSTTVAATPLVSATSTSTTTNLASTSTSTLP